MSVQDLCTQVTVEVQGMHPKQLHDRALAVAAQFFEVDEKQLRVSAYEARPGPMTMSGGPSYWKADITVFLVTP
jgi:hypothetical protein